MNFQQFKNDISFNFRIALEAIMANTLQSLLTALGIIFGVAAVIAMMAIGNGAQQEILKQIKLVGVNNIVIQPLVQKEDQSKPAAKEKKKYSPGLSVDDANSIQAQIPGVKAVSAEIVINTMATFKTSYQPVKLIGISSSFFNIYNFNVESGNDFNAEQELGGAVCIIGKGLQTKLFNGGDPIGESVKVGNNRLKIIGVLEERKVPDAAMSTFGIRNFDMDVYMPIKSVLLRYVNRSLVTTASLAQGGNDDDDNSDSNSKKEKNNNQTDKLVVQIDKSEMLGPTAEVIGRLLERKHNNVTDFEIVIPELLLKQQQKTKDIFNMVLAAIAGISLVVGGIGIMNIMLASVMERIKEIGIRLSIGATKEHIILQFLCEAVFISLIGGLIGILLGVSLSFIISRVTDIDTIISVTSIVVSFGVSVSVGLVFGIMPARRAAMQDPITSLRHD